MQKTKNPLAQLRNNAMRLTSRTIFGFLAGCTVAGSAVEQSHGAPMEMATGAAVSVAAEQPIPPSPSTPSAQTPAQQTVPERNDRSNPAEPVGRAIGVEVLRQLAAAAPNLGSPEERAALAAFYESRGAQPLWVKGGGLSPHAELAILEITRADEWGLRAADFALPSLAMAATAGSESTKVDLAGAELKLSLAVLKYARHARGGRMMPGELSNYIDRKPPLLEPKTVLEQIAKAEAPDAYLRGLHPQHPQFEQLRQAYRAVRSGQLPLTAGVLEERPPKSDPRRKGAAKADTPADRKLLYNMEQWRWMPDNLGDTYVWVNIPEFTLRVVQHGKVVLTERVVTGQPYMQTPMFSAEMESIVFHPSWGVPDSIKVKEVLPTLLRGRGDLERQGLRIQYRGRDVDPYDVDWSAVDIRNFHVYQPPGRSNALGVVKFLFPNRHQVYMHDTPTKSLFDATQRTFSHGCIRVRNPVRLAEVLLAEDQGWEPNKIAALIKSGPLNNNVPLTKNIPVHITYFTAWVDDTGKLNTRPDVYGHEARIQLGLEGKAHLIVKRKQDPGPVRAEAVARLAETKASWTMRDFLHQVFGGEAFANGSGSAHGLRTRRR
jgi:L,D-transpeptidase YcbB